MNVIIRATAQAIRVDIAAPIIPMYGTNIIFKPKLKNEAKTHIDAFILVFLVKTIIWLKLLLIPYSIVPRATKGVTK